VRVVQDCLGESHLHLYRFTSFSIRNRKSVLLDHQNQRLQSFCQGKGIGFSPVVEVDQCAEAVIITYSRSALDTALLSLTVVESIYEDVEDAEIGVSL